MFWFFGHPEVYIIFLPATGFVSSILPTFARWPIFGYTALVLALFATSFLEFGPRVHHIAAHPGHAHRNREKPSRLPGDAESKKPLRKQRSSKTREDGPVE
ncbi:MULTISPECIES: cbb3-type cytochrome c oxidase subunit I [Azospirillum]|uniref:cbb3-type cytochrome c oxidase subunit I n=1 Tax=Azospirillum TaxID=191 RepID=UPI002482A486|nr:MULTISPECIES: cbb3-type cytochrome c oxidase subunit I [Azospirillum]MDW5531494.1 cbb3-type cytochrome c oxidase subunit I [Azospirillum sp. NL1]